MKLSIITINYNNLEGLKKTVNSILSQTWRDFEWIIVDGGSTDGSKEYIEKLAQSLSEGTAIDSIQWHVERFSLLGFTAEDLKGNTSDSGLYQSSTDNRQSPIANRPQRFLWCSEPDKGVYNAMNKGIAMARGEYLNFMNSGDCFYEKETLEKVFSCKMCGDMVYGDWIRQYKDHEEFCYAQKNAFERLAYFKNVCHQAMFVHSSVQKIHLYDESCRALADLKLWLELPFEGFCYQYLPVTVCRFWAEDGLTSGPEADAKNKAERIRILYSEKIPSEYRAWLLKYIEEHDKYMYCEYNYLISSTYRLIHDRRLFRRLIKMNILFISFLKKIMDVIRPNK